MKFLLILLEHVTTENRWKFEIVRNQINGVAQLGNEAHTMNIEDDALILHSGKGEVRHPLPPEGKRRVREAIKAACKIVEQNQYDYIYLRGDHINKAAVKLAVCAKERNFGAKVMFEAAPYRSRAEYKSLSKKLLHSGDRRGYRAVRVVMREHRRYQRAFKKVGDTIAVFGTPIDEAWGMPALMLENGICVSQVTPVKRVAEQGSRIRILGIADNPLTDGLDRLIYGLKGYEENQHRDDLSLDIVGSSDQTLSLRLLAEELGVSGRVSFLGEKTDEQLNELYGDYDLGAACLGLYKADMAYASPRSNKQFCAAGLPFLYVSDDSLLTEAAFALSLPNNDSPVNLSLISEFMWRCRLNPRLAHIERKFAEKNYDWRVIMKRLIEFTATGRREV